MNETKFDQLRSTISTMLADRGHPRSFADGDSLFDSGLLDSMSAVNLLMELERLFDLDLADPDFDISRIDTFDEIRMLVGEQEAA